MAVGSKINAQQALLNHQLRYAKKGTILGLCSGAAWGLDGVLMGIAGAMAPFWVEGYTIPLIIVASLAAAAMHDLFAGGYVAIYNVFTGRWREYARTLKTKPGKVILVASLFGGPVAMSGYLIGMSLAGVTYASAISAIYPALGALLGVVFLKEKITKRVWIGIIACMIGAAVVGYSPPEGGAEMYPYFYIGIAVSLLPAIGWASEGVISTFGMDVIDPDIAIGIRMLAGGLTLLLAIPIIGVIAGVKLAGLSIMVESIAMGKPMLWVAAAGLAGGLTFMSWYKAMNMTGVGRAMAFNVTYALWSIPFGMLFAKLGFYNFQISTQAIFGAIIITIGTICVVANPKELLNLRD